MYLLSETLSALGGACENTTIRQGFAVRNWLWPGLKVRKKRNTDGRDICNIKSNYFNKRHVNWVHYGQKQVVNHWPTIFAEKSKIKQHLNLTI